MSSLTNDAQKRPFGRLLRRAYDDLCNKAGAKIPMKQLALDMGVNPDQLSRYMNGHTTPYRDTKYLLEDFARVFQIPYHQVRAAARERPRKGVHYTAEGKYTISLYPEPLVTSVEITKVGNHEQRTER